MTWFRLPIFVWTLYATSFLFLMAVPVLAMALIWSSSTRLFGIGIYDPALGGDPLLYPAHVLVLFPSGGLHHDSARHGDRQRGDSLLCPKALFGYRSWPMASFGIAMLGFFVWGHHMFVAGIVALCGA